MPAANLLLSILQNHGVEVDRFGTSSGTLTGLGLELELVRHVIVFIAIVISWSISSDASADKLQEFLNKNCLACHGAERQENDQRFDDLGNDFSKIETLVVWQGILDQLNLGEMPPVDSPQPTREAASQFIEQLTLQLKSALCRPPQHGRADSFATAKPS